MHQTSNFLKQMVRVEDQVAAFCGAADAETANYPGLMNLSGEFAKIRKKRPSPAFTEPKC